MGKIEIKNALRVRKQNAQTASYQGVFETEHGWTADAFKRFGDLCEFLGGRYNIPCVILDESGENGERRFVKWEGGTI